jgi:nucleoside-diphosphate-sugar epimerase
LGPDNSSGFELLRNLLNGSMKAVPNFEMNVIDVRDVADLHIRAMVNPNAKGQRFLALAGGKISMPEIALFLKNKMPQVAQKVSTKRLPNWLVSIAALYSPQARNIASMLKAKRDNVSNQKAQQFWTGNL